MTDVDRILDEYVADHRAGKKAAPREYLERVSAAERAELAALIDAYLDRAAPGRWDAEGFAGSSAQRLVTRLEPMLEGESMWRYVLPSLRQDARVKRSDLVTRLARALGVGDRAEKVGDYYHQMETGRLAPEGVNRRVLEELGKIVGASADALRRAGHGLGSIRPGPEGEQVAFARAARPRETEALPRSPGTQSPREAKHDEVDRLFLDG